MLATVVNPSDLWLKQQSLPRSENNYERVIFSTTMLEETPETSDSARDTSPAWSYYIKEARTAEKVNQFSKAERFWHASLRILEQLEVEDVRLPYVLDHLLNNLLVQRKFAAAEVCGVEALQLMVATFGNSDLRTVNCMNNLAGAFYGLGRMKEAEAFAVHVLSEFNKAYGKDDLLVGRASRNLAMVYHSQGNWQLAELLYERALAVFKRELGSGDVDVTELIENYANVLKMSGQMQKSQQLRAELRRGVWHEFKCPMLDQMVA